MTSTAEASLSDIEQWLGTIDGCLAPDESTYMHSHWNRLAFSGAQPKPVREPDAYDGTDSLTILCTQLNAPAAKKRALERRWCEALPTFGALRTVWFESRVSQELFDAVCRVPALTGLWMKWTGVRDFSAVRDLSSLRYLHVGQSGAAESLEPFSGLRNLRWLQLSGFNKVDSLEPLSELAALEGFGFTGGDGKATVVHSLQPLERLSSLQWLHLGALRTADNTLRPLGKLHELRWLGLPNTFAMEEYAWLASRLPNTSCDLLQPFCRFHRSAFPCFTCKLNFRVMTTGKASKLLCPVCDGKRLAKHVLAFQTARAAAQ